MARRLHRSAPVHPTIALLVWGATQGTAGPRPPIVAILPIDGDSGLAEVDREHLREHAADALRATLHAPPQTVMPEVPATCTAAPCLSRTLQAHDVTHWLGARVSGDARSYDVAVELWAIGGDTPLARAEDHCTVCGQQELRDMVAAHAIRMQAFLPANAADVGHVRASVEESPSIVAAPRDRVPRRSNAMRIGGYASFGVAAAAIIAGSTLVAIDGHPIERRCEDEQAPVIDADGDCRYMHQTLGGGIALVVGGVLATGGGITLLTIDAHRRKRDARVSLRIGPRRIALEGRF